MKWYVCLFLLVGVCVSDAKRGSFRYRGKSGGNVGSRSSCQRMPRPMSLDRFRSEVENSRYTLILIWTSYELDLISYLYYHFSFVFSETAENGVFGQFVSGRQANDTGDGDCTETSARTMTAIHSQYAVFDRENNAFNVFFFSTNPGNYVIEVACDDLSGTLPGRQCCEGRWSYSIFSKNDPPHFLDWKGISRDLSRQMGLCLSNLYFSYGLNDCPNAEP